MKDIENGNMVTLQVWKDGQDPASGIPQAQIPASVEGGAAKGKWMYRSFGTDVPPSSDPKFFFSAHSAWCPMKKSSSATVELKRPEIKKAEWKDNEDSSTSKGLVGDVFKLCAETKDVESGVTFTIYNKTTEEKVANIGADMKGDKAEAEWRASDPREKGDTNELHYYFTVTASKAKECKSGDIQVKNPQVVTMEWDKKACLWGKEIELTIKTFEMEDIAPQSKVNVWEEERKNQKKMLLSSDVTLDKEEVKVKFKMDFKLDDVSEFDQNDDYRVYATVDIEEIKKFFKQEEDVYLIVSDDF